MSIRAPLNEQFVDFNTLFALGFFPICDLNCNRSLTKTLHLDKREERKEK